MKYVRITYILGGQETIEVTGYTEAGSIIQALTIANLRQRKTGHYKVVQKVEVAVELNPAQSDGTVLAENSWNNFNQ